MASAEHLKVAEKLARDLAARPGGGQNEESVSRAELRPVITHYLREGNLEATLRLLDTLPRSGYARRSKKTAGQYRRLQRLLTPLFRRYGDEDPAALRQILGWTSRFLDIHRKLESSQRPGGSQHDAGSRPGRPPHSRRHRPQR